MIPLSKLRRIGQPKILILGNHQGIVQSILDFDFLAGKKRPSVIGVVGVRRRQLRFFWGDQEILIPGFLSLETIDPILKNQTDLFVVAQSGRRATTVGAEALQKLPNVLGGMIFAEGVPERQAIELGNLADQHGKFVLGPASVGLVIAGVVKLGVIGGTLPEQIVGGGLLSPGSVAVISTSGGMVNELINLVAAYGSGVSFAAAVGGERFPTTKPAELVRQALNDSKTGAIVYFGELGGTDEHEIAEVLKKAKTPKPFIAYIAGSFAENFEVAPQFGHAKALAQAESETASAKKQVLRDSGAIVPDSFARFEKGLSKLPRTPKNLKLSTGIEESLLAMQSRSPALFANRVSTERDGDVQILGVPLIEFASKRSLSEIALAMFLGKQPRSKKFVKFFDTCLRLLVDHGPQVSGAVNTMVTTRAGKDLTAALASGILTIGPRFGGAINQAAQSWFEAVNSGESAGLFVERHAQNKQYIAGIGHRKYSLDNPDPRVMQLLSDYGSRGHYTSFAKQVEKITTRKKGQLILNVDGAIAALLLDLLAAKEKYADNEIAELLKTDFCNAIFVYSRTVGLIAHHLEQQRLDEGLFRLMGEQVSFLS